MLIRLASPADAQELVQLNAAFNEVENITADDVRRSLEASGEIVIVAEAEGAVVAFCCAQVHHSFCYPFPVAEITEMYVDAPCRHRGCAAAMLRFLESHLRDTFAVDELHLLTGVHNTAAQAAYKRAGFHIKNEVYMVKDI